VPRGQPRRWAISAWVRSSR